MKSGSALLAAFTLPLSFFGLVFVAISYFLITMPSVDQMRKCMTTSMYDVRLCPTDSTYTKFADISPSLVDAVVASEDAAFFQHQGFDWFEIRASFSRNLEEGKYTRGGSTITQQLAKNVFLTKSKSLVRKVREAFLTYEIERKFSKKEILERYLNVVEFGPKIFGIKAAANYYFQRAPDQLNLLESAYLAFLLPNPKGYHKSFAQNALTPFAQGMIKIIIHRLLSFKKISAESAEFALAHLTDFPWANLTPADFDGPLPDKFGDESIVKEDAGESTVSAKEIQAIIDEELKQHKGDAPAVESSDEAPAASDEESVWE